MALVVKGPKVQPGVGAILSYYDSATEDQKVAGRLWYAKAGALARLIAEDTGIEVERVGYAIAALSPRNPWRWNVFDAWAYCVAAAAGRTMPTANTFKRNQLAAWRAITGEGAQAPWVTAAPKVRAFVAAILGDEEAVVIDTWAVRAATYGGKTEVRTEADYARFAHAYNLAANFRNEPPAHMQAIVWLVAQSEGLASSRRGRHDLAFKAGTPEWLQEALTK